jgi:hypothetical protein
VIRTRGYRLAAIVLGWTGAVLVGGCSYSFTGASVPPHLSTIAIPLVDDQSGYGEPGLRELFTSQLNDLFIADNSFQISDRSSADAVLEGVITRVTDAPQAVGGEEQVRTRRVTVTVRFTFEDKKLRKTVWEKTFSNWGEYTSLTAVSQVRAGLEEAMRRVSEDVLLETVSGW